MNATRIQNLMAGTLWSEQPMYFQLVFALDRVKALDEAKQRRWTVVSIKDDWKRILRSRASEPKQISFAAWRPFGFAQDRLGAKNKILISRKAAKNAKVGTRIWTVADMKNDWKRIFPFEKN